MGALLRQQRRRTSHVRHQTSAGQPGREACSKSKKTDASAPVRQARCRPVGPQRRNAATGEPPSLVLLGYDTQRAPNIRYRSSERQKRGGGGPTPHPHLCRTSIRPDTTERRFKPGDNVLARNFNKTHPWSPAWKGPHRIDLAAGPSVFNVEKDGAVSPNYMRTTYDQHQDPHRYVNFIFFLL